MPIPREQEMQDNLAMPIPQTLAFLPDDMEYILEELTTLRANYNYKVLNGIAMIAAHVRAEYLPTLTERDDIRDVGAACDLLERLPVFQGPQAIEVPGP